MEKLREFLMALDQPEREKFAARCGTSWKYLRKKMYMRQPIGAHIAVELERNSDGAIPSEDTCPEIDWAFIRQSCNRVKAEAV